MIELFERCLHTGAECKRPMGYVRACYWCDVPSAFGYFWTAERGWKAEQRFIMPKEREARLAWLDNEIEKLQERRRALLAIPSKEEYDKINSR